MDLLLSFAPAVVAALAAMVVGFLWYSPLLFARPWMIAMGHDPDDKAKAAEMKKTAGPLYASAFVASLVTATVLLFLFRALWIHDVVNGIKVGVFIWAGFVAPIKFTDAIFGRRGRTLLFIDSGYQLLCFVAMGAVLGAWK